MAELMQHIAEILIYTVQLDVLLIMSVSVQILMDQWISLVHPVCNTDFLKTKYVYCYKAYLFLFGLLFTISNFQAMKTTEKDF